MLECVLDYALYTSFRFSWKLPFLEKSKKKSSKSKRYSWWLGIIQIQRSFNLQNVFFVISKNIWTDFFHVIQRILQQAAPGQKVSCWSRTWWGSYCGQPEWSSFGGGCTRSKVLHFSFPTFFVVFHLFIFIFCCKHYVTVRNTNYFLCFSQFEIECMCFVCFRVSVQLIEEKYCCDCLFLFLWVCKARLGPN